MTGYRLIALCMACAALGGQAVNLAWITTMQRRDRRARARTGHADHLRDAAAHPHDQRAQQKEVNTWRKP